MTEKKTNNLVKTGIIGVVAGLLGGGVAYAGLSQANNENAIQSGTPLVKTVKNTSKNSGEMNAA